MKRSWRWPLAGFVVGGLVGATFLTVNIVSASSPRGAPAAHVFGEILHTPPQLVERNQPVALNFDVVCGMLVDQPGPRCTPTGALYVRASGAREFDRQSLTQEPDGQLSAQLPGRYASGAGFDYYVDVDDGWGASAVLPEGGAEAPQHVWVASDSNEIRLGAPGRPRLPDGVAVRASWGVGERALGLDSGREQSRIGPSAFDVTSDGAVVVLDQVNRRLAFYRGTVPPRHLPIPFSGGEGDLAVAGDGVVYVLDAGGSRSGPIVRSFDAAGRHIAATRLAERAADMIRVGPGGSLVHAYPSEMWLPTGSAGSLLAPDRQVELASPPRPVSVSRGVVVHATPSEARFALVDGDRVLHSWLVRASTSFGEVQLAEPYGGGLLAVVRLWTEARAEFRVLRLTPAGLAKSFSVARGEWAETAPLSRFRLRGTTLYQLRSAPSGIEIAAFEIGGTT